ncbi:MAG TPA: DUF6291 domain-containing protein [Bacteroidia bacterium]|nr:DUF6291 domain-containing protein [Bacteroidia bacterium]
MRIVATSQKATIQKKQNPVFDRSSEVLLEDTGFFNFRLHKMAENKKSIVVYADWIKKFEALSDEEAGRLIKHFFRYVNDLNPTAPDRITELSFIDIELCLKRDLIKWEQRAERSRENGKLGGRPSSDKPEETQQVILKPKEPDSGIVSVNDNVNEIIIKPKKDTNRTKLTKVEFKDLLTPFLGTYTKDLLNEFYLYWTEQNITTKKMRFEDEKFFDVSRRLATWFKNQKSNKNGTHSPTPPIYSINGLSDDQLKDF